MEPWRKVFRDGVCSALHERHLEILQIAIEQDDPTLLQDCTTAYDLSEDKDETSLCIGACAIAYCGWKEGLNTVFEVEQFFALTCADIDHILNEPNACRHFLNWFDENPKEIVYPAVLEEIKAELIQRHNICEGEENSHADSHH